MLTSWHGLQAVGVLLMSFLRALHDVFWNCFGVVHAAKTVAFYETWQHAGRTVAMESVEVKTRIDNARLEKKYCQCVGRMVKQHNARCRVNCVVFLFIFFIVADINQNIPTQTLPKYTKTETSNVTTCFSTWVGLGWTFCVWLEPHGESTSSMPSWSTKIRNVNKRTIK